MGNVFTFGLTIRASSAPRNPSNGLSVGGAIGAISKGLAVLTAFGAGAVTLMMLCYALEQRAVVFTLLFALACFAASAYGWLAGTWPFGVVELAWGFVALWRWNARRATA